MLPCLTVEKLMLDLEIVLSRAQPKADHITAGGGNPDNHGSIVDLSRSRTVTGRNGTWKADVALYTYE